MKLAYMLKYILLSTILISCAYQDKKQVSDTSEIKRLQFSFEQIKKAGWDANSDLLWGYYFIDPDEERLRRLGQHLESLGFRFVEVSRFIKDKDEADDYMLHVEKVEKHSPATLAKRNQEFRAIAAKYGVKAYDGWDVGEVK
jgi:hypothetical protein